MKKLVLIFALMGPLQANSLPSEQRKNGKLVQTALLPVQKFLQESSAVIYNNADRKPFIYGTVVSPDGLILTKATEIAEIEKFHVRVGTKRYKEPTILARNEVWDLALLKIEASDLIPVDLFGSSEVEHGTWAVSNGATDRKFRRPRPGIISANKRAISGGTPAVLGVQFKLVEKFITLTNVTEKSGAEAAGLKKGDQIIGVNGEEIASEEEFVKILRGKSAGDLLPLRIRREGETLEVEVELMPRHKLFGGPQNRNDQMSGDFSERRSSFPMVLQHETMLSARSVGGPLFTLDGHFLGMNIAAANRVEAYAIPVEDLRKVLDEMKKAAGL